jgi:aminoglycoside phosphotransferase (APT) family kinase protein
MPRTRMHAGQVPTSVALVRRLIAGQFPGWTCLPVTELASSGTDHDLYRLGEQLVVRLPVIGWATGQAVSEAQWLPRLAPHLPLAVPTQVALGRPGEGYPYAWSVCGWLPGRQADAALRDDPRAAVDLAGFVRALRQVDTSGAPRRSAGARGSPLAELDDAVRQSIAVLGDRIDGAGAVRSWEQSLAAVPWHGADVWVHGDLLPGNVLVRDGRVSSVIDFGALSVGDPACDLLAACNLFQGAARAGFLTELDTDEDARLRGRGWALAQAVIALPYYWNTNAGIVSQAQHAVAQVLAEPA